MTQSTLIERRAAAAEWNAKQALRAGRKGDATEFAYYQNRMLDVLEDAPYPYTTACELVRMVGRSKAMVLKIERPIINLALSAQH